ncbi:MAG: thiamine pyrophosphate-dependent enzyme [Bacteroidota bacterium]
MIKTSKKITRNKAFNLHRELLLPRLIEERMLKLLRQNKISKWFSGIGQEAISVGLGLTARPEDFILPMHRNLGVFTTRRVPFYPLFCQLLGKSDGFTQGRERSFHFGVLEHRIVGMISHLAAMMPVADGLALAKQLKGEQSVVFSFCGDGATSEGDFHEALNLAAVWDLPVVFIIENNGYGLSTPTREQYACDHLVERAVGYGMHGLSMNGNNVFEVIDTITKARKLALKGKPVLVEAHTFRMRGHEEASGTAYIPDALMRSWEEKDPIMNLEHWMVEEELATEEDFPGIYKEVEALFRPELDQALTAEEPLFDVKKETGSVFAVAHPPHQSDNPTSAVSRRFIDAIQHTLHTSFHQDERFVMMGQDIAEYGGVFKITEGFVEAFGKERIRNTPIIESGILGAAVGLALDGFKPVVEMQFADFISCGMNQIIQNIAKSHYRWTPPLNITIRAPHGAGVGAGPFHSQSPEGWFMPHSGLKIVVPATVEDAQNLLFSAMIDPNPVLIFEHKKLYRSLKESVPEYPQYEELGKARVRRAGTDASIITYGMGVHWALKRAETFKTKGIELEVLDLRTLAPLDVHAILDTVKRTGRVLLLQEPSQTMGPMSEVSAIISEQAFSWLDAPVMRCSALDIPIPFNKQLEDGYLNSVAIDAQLTRLLEY